jgi:hypothetical protein
MSTEQHIIYPALLTVSDRHNIFGLYAFFAFAQHRLPSIIVHFVPFLIAVIRIIRTLRIFSTTHIVPCTGSDLTAVV